MRETFRPLGNRVLLEMYNPPTKTKEGVIIPNNAAMKDEFRRSKVIAVGPGRDGITSTGAVILIPCPVKEGDIVITAVAQGDRVAVSEGANPTDNPRILMDASAILAVVEMLPE